VTTDKSDLLHGTLAMLILKAIQLEPMHGWGITVRIEHYALTGAGRRRFTDERAQWLRRSRAVTLVPEATSTKS
jgi:DNA-binding PadR family transcriptional regulator